MPARFRAIVSGLVQLVGFRAFASRRAKELGVAGFVRNLPSGEVEVEAEGEKELLERFLADLRRGPPGAQVHGISATWQEPKGETSRFEIRW